VNDLPPLAVAVGIDVVETERVKRMFHRWGDRFLNRFFTKREQAQLRGRTERMAALISAKEAASKALGLGLRGLGWKEMEVLHAITGKPTLYLNGRAERRAKESGWFSTSVSLTHDGGVTVAVVVALYSDRNQP
jgi:holo-[acyl-carrier protein] synthase